MKISFSYLMYKNPGTYGTSSECINSENEWLWLLIAVMVLIGQTDHITTFDKGKVVRRCHGCSNVDGRAEQGERRGRTSRMGQGEDWHPHVWPLCGLVRLLSPSAVLGMILPGE